MSSSIEITEKQAEYIRNANKRWNFAVGAVRSGKSHIAIQKTQKPPNRAVFVLFVLYFL